MKYDSKSKTMDYTEKEYKKVHGFSPKMKKMAGKVKKTWAETHGQKEGEQLKGTITGRKFGPKSY